MFHVSRSMFQVSVDSFIADFQCRAVGLVVCTAAFGPSVVVGVAEIQTSLYLLQPDAVTTVVIGSLGEVRVLDVAAHMVAVVLNADVDEAGLCGAYAMLEGILDERDEDHWSHFVVQVDTIRFEGYIDSRRYAQPHEFHVVS